MADILIRGMEMPEMPERMKHEQEEPYVDIRVFASGKAVISTGKRPYYKEFDVVHLPKKHGRLIDADALDRAFTDLRFNSDGTLNHWGDRPGWCMHGYEVEKLIADAPTIVPAEGGTDDGV